MLLYKSVLRRFSHPPTNQTHQTAQPQSQNLSAPPRQYKSLIAPPRFPDSGRDGEDTAALDPERERENAHWEGCKLRKDGREMVAGRVPDLDRVCGRWNDVVY